MSKKVLITVLAVGALLIGALLLYVIFGGSGAMNNPFGNGNSTGKNFEIQGMKVELLQEGSGNAAKTGDYITAHYVGTLEDGTEFDSSVRRSVPFTFQLGGNVITGWNLGVEGMKVGEKRKLTIPSELAYGLDGFPPTIPPKATLLYTVEVLNINPGQ